MSPINLLVVEDHAIIRAGICALLENIAGVTITGVAGDGHHNQENNILSSSLIQEMLLQINLLDMQGSV